MNTEKLELHAIVELFGHQRIAGKVTEQTVGSASFVRVDVPETKTQPGFTRLLNPSAVYAINPVTEEVANEYAASLQVKPIQAYDIRAMVDKMMEHKQLKEANTEEAEESTEEEELPFD